MKQISILLLALGLVSSPLAAATASNQSPTFGVVNFNQCVSDSKIGKQEQANFDSIKKQMTVLIEETEKEINEINLKFNDPEYMDGLSPEAEDQLKTKFRLLNEEMSRHQNEYYQKLQQANMRILQSLSMIIQQAAERVAAEKHLTGVINKEAFFFYTPTLDVTNLVIAEMDKTFDSNVAKKQMACN